MTDDLLAKLVLDGRVSQALAERRRAKEQPVPQPQTRPGASRGFLAGHLGHHVRFIRNTLRLSGMLSRGRANARALQVNYRDIEIAGLPAAFDGYTLMHLSDLHLDIAPDLVTVIAAAVKPLLADAVVITGDFRAATNGDVTAAAEAFAQLYPHLNAPVYAVLGNHDPVSIITALEALGASVLLNEHVMIDRHGAALAIAGVDDPHYFGTDDLDAALAGIPAGTAKVLLAHTPEIYARAADAGVDLLLAGHTHGGQICLPGGFPVIVNADCPRRYCRGQWRHGSMQGYTSVGTGSSVIDVRFNCPPEIAIHRLITART